jgi:hypothetical protein
MSISPERLKEIQNIPDSDIDTSDIPELGEPEFSNVNVVLVYRLEKRQI